MTRWVRHAWLLGLCLFLPAAARAGASASDTWGQVGRDLVVQPGTSVSCWSDPARSQITNGPMAMVPVGDGTYETVVGLIRGQTYNYFFFVNAGASPAGRLTAFNTYYDIVPTSGRINASTNGVAVNETTAARYGQAGNFDARRILTVPASLNPGDTLWVFNNLGETPGVVTSLLAYAEGDTQIRLQWDGPYGFWGTGGEAFKAADVLAGGRIEILRADTSGGLYTQVAAIDGKEVTWLDSGLASANTYYYVVRCRDAYQGGLADSFPQRLGDTTAPVHSSPQGPVNTYFIVQGADEEVLASKGWLAYLTPWGEPPTSPKWAGRMVRIFLPPALTGGGESTINSERSAQKTNSIPSGRAAHDRLEGS